MSKKVKFFLPGIGDDRLIVLNSSLIDKMDKYPDFFRPFEIGAVYGSPPKVAWSGGRFTHGFFTGEQALKEVAFYNSKDIPIRYTFTNSLITDALLYDQASNLLMNIANNDMNEVLLISDTLENYIRKNYPGFKICLSTTKRITDKDQYDQYKGKYDYIVLDYTFNHKPEIWELDDKEHIELLVMTYCEDECPNRMHHQYIANVSDLEIDSPRQHYGRFICPYFQSGERAGWTFHDHYRAHKHVISIEDLWTKYVDAGYCNFKLEGRGNNIFDVMESYITYLVLPEHMDFIRLAMAKDITGLTKVEHNATTIYKPEKQKKED